jgi:hypothetical protein
MMRGSTPADAHAVTRASGVTPDRAARDALINTTAAPPSVIPEDVPAVEIPPGKTGASFRSDSSVVSGRGCSSAATTTVRPLASVTVTGAISRVK